MFFGPIGKQDCRLASDWLGHFRLLLWNRWTEFNETWQESRSQRPLPSLCFSAIRKTRHSPGLALIGWDIFDFSPETAERNSTKFNRKQDLNVFYQVCVFRANRREKKILNPPPLPRLLIFWDIFDFPSETAERNSTKLNRKQDFNVLYQVCVFRVNRKKQDGRPGLWLALTAILEYKTLYFQTSHCHWNQYLRLNWNYFFLYEIAPSRATQLLF